MANEITLIELNPVQSASAPVPQLPPRATPQTLSIAGAASAVFGRGTTLIGLHTNTACTFEVGADPAGTTNKIPLPANVWVFWGVQPNHKAIFKA